MKRLNKNNIHYGEGYEAIRECKLYTDEKDTLLV